MSARRTQHPAHRSPPGPGPGSLQRDRHSGWQLAHRVWQDSGVSWEHAPAAADAYSPETDPYAANAYSAPWYPAGPVAADRYEADQDEAEDYEADQDEAERYTTDPDEPEQYEAEQYETDPDQDEEAGQHAGLSEPHPVQASGRYAGDPAGAGQPSAPRRPAFTPAPSPAAPPAPPRAFTGTRAFSVGPLGAPVAAAALVAPDVPSPAESDELFRAWQGSVREASARSGPWAGRPASTPPRPARGRGRGRGRGGQAVKIALPAAVIVTVGAGALLMLTGRANEMLAQRASAGPAAAPTPGFSASLSPVNTTLAGYPGEHGTVGVTGMWSAAGLTVAVGYADNHAAVWRRAPDGNWSLVSASTLGGLTAHLTAVSEGPLGWIAVGSVSENGTVEPMAYQSADGVTWTPLPALTALAGDQAQFLGVTAGPGGYVVVGRQGSGTHTSAAMWWSGDLTGWVSGGNSGSPGSFAAAVVSVGNGFAAVGSAANCHTIWTSADGQRWAADDLAKPDGAQTATLRSVAANGAGRLVAAGFATRNGSDIPIVVASTDGGAQVTQVVLNAPAGPATVTAVTATSSGFVAVGLAGPPAAQRAVSWTSPDGLTWSAATPLTTAGSSEVTALTDTSAATAGPAGSGSSGTAAPVPAPSVTGAAQLGASAALLTVPG